MQKCVICTNCIVMEYAECGELCDFMLLGRLNENTVRYVFKQLLSVFIFINSKGFVHLDIKPDNIFVSSNY